jgi:uncharacterized protein (DUF1330 family)
MDKDPATGRRGYIYVEMKSRDPERFKQYTALSGPAVKAAGGRYIVAGARLGAAEFRMLLLEGAA